MSKRIIKLTESDLESIVRKVLKEQSLWDDGLNTSDEDKFDAVVSFSESIEDLLFSGAIEFGDPISEQLNVIYEVLFNKYAPNDIKDNMTDNELDDLLGGTGVTPSED